MDLSILRIPETDHKRNKASGTIIMELLVIEITVIDTSEEQLISGLALQYNVHTIDEIQMLDR